MKALVKNLDTYVTVVEADEWVKDNYRSSSPEFKAWFDSGNTAEDKSVVLRASAKALNNLRYKGRKATASQALAFPRKFNTFPGQIFIPYQSQFSDSTLLEGIGGSSDGLESVREAQVVNAVAHMTLDPEIVVEVTERTVAALRSKSNRTISETYDTSTERTSNLLTGIYAHDRVMYILNAWITDSVFSL